jgi:hypothetical protein
MRAPQSNVRPVATVHERLRARLGVTVLNLTVGAPPDESDERRR